MFLFHTPMTLIQPWPIMFVLPDAVTPETPFIHVRAELHFAQPWRKANRVTDGATVIELSFFAVVFCRPAVGRAGVGAEF